MFKMRPGLILVVCVFGVLLPAVTVGRSAHDGFFHRINNYEVISPMWRSGANGEAVEPHLRSQVPPRTLQLDFSAFGKNFDLKLRKNYELFASNYKELHIDAEGNIIPRDDASYKTTNCFFKGKVVSSEEEGKESWAVINICAGESKRATSGLIYAFGEEFSLEPAPHYLRREDSSEEEASIIFRTSDIREDEEDATRTCATMKIHPPINSTKVMKRREAQLELRTRELVPKQRFTFLYVSPIETFVAHRRFVFFASSCTRYVAIVLVNDYSRYNSKGSQTESLGAEIMSYVRTRYSSSIVTWDCKIEIRLIGQITFTSANPSGLSYRACNTYDDFLTGLQTGGTCCGSSATWLAACAQSYVECLDEDKSVNVEQTGCFDHYSNYLTAGDGRRRRMVTVTDVASKSSGEIDPIALLDSVSAYFYDSDRRSEIGDSFGNLYDSVQLLSSKDFAGSTIGMAKLTSMCTKSSAAIGDIFGRTSFEAHVTVAHELGHTFGMSHDSGAGCPTSINCNSVTDDPPCGCPPCGYVMAATDAGPTATHWTQCSVDDMNEYLDEDYGTGFYGTCLNSDVKYNDCDDWTEAGTPEYTLCEDEEDGAAEDGVDEGDGVEDGADGGGAERLMADVMVWV
ncbi:Disintegrin and metalloproteinase domain-containing protein 8 [Balamuthia mandrillaris]